MPPVSTTSTWPAPPGSCWVTFEDGVEDVRSAWPRPVVRWEPSWVVSVN